MFVCRDKRLVESDFFFFWLSRRAIPSNFVNTLYNENYQASNLLDLGGYQQEANTFRRVIYWQLISLIKSRVKGDSIWAGGVFHL